MFIAKLRVNCRDFLYALCPNMCITSPIININHQSDPVITTDKPVWRHHNHLKSIVYLRAHSYTFYGLGQVSNNMLTFIHLHIVSHRIMLLP